MLKKINNIGVLFQKKVDKLVIIMYINIVLKKINVF